MAEISNTENYLDVRDIIERVEQLEELEQPGPVDTGNPEDEDVNQDDLFAELSTLRELLDDLRGNGEDHKWKGDWYPVSLIRDSYFETAMDEMLKDLGEMPKDIPSYLRIEVDYDALQSDYSSVDYDGETYWYR